MGAAGACLRILTRNLGDVATLSATGGINWVSSLPFTNLQRPTERARTARTTSTSWALRGQFTTQQKGNMVALTRTNFSGSCTFGMQLWSDAFVTSTYVGSGQPAYPTTGLNSDIDIPSETDFANLRNAVYYFPQRTDILGFQTQTNDLAPLNTYMEATRLWFGTYYELQYSPKFDGGVEFSFDDASVQSRADDGTQVVEKKYKKRTLKLNLDLITDTDLPTLLALARYAGKDKEIFLSLYPGWGGVKELYNQVACRIVDSPTFNPYQVGLHKNTITFEET